MKPTVSGIGLAALCFSWAVPAVARKCPPDSVPVGPVCIDKYEASVWQIDPASKALVKKVQAGNATLADLTRGGATQLSAASACTTPYPTSFPADGNWVAVPGSKPPSPGVYAVSIAGVQPSGCTTWFQANQACALSGKRLLRNDEWQRAAAGTPDPGIADNGTSDCNVSSAFTPVKTGSRMNCKSNWGVFDMVGNVDEWVADWADLAIDCTDWKSSAGFSDGDISCFGGPGNTSGDPLLSNLSLPGALIRGGDSGDRAAAGVFAVRFAIPSIPFVGFRCAR